MYLLGADRLGRDMLSRIVYGTRISMSIGLIGVTLSLAPRHRARRHFRLLRRLDRQRHPARHRVHPVAADDASVARPRRGHADQLAAAARSISAITIILSLIGWTSLARVIRGRFLSLRTEDFVTAARLDGAREPRIIFRHMAPSFVSHIIAEVSLAIPGMILAETALSFLGSGLQPPIVSWGVLLQEAQNIRAIATAPWLFAPGHRRGDRRACPEFRRRRTARCRRSLRPMTMHDA